MATVLLVRHGETDWNRDRRVQGWAPVGLNERGREQARAAGAHLAEAYDIDRVVASDLRRTRETAALACESLSLDPIADRDWRERSLGVFQGLDYVDVFGEHPEYDATSGHPDALEARPEKGESLLDVRERVLRAWQSVLDGLDSDRSSSAGESTTRDGNEETVLVVTHGGPIYLLLAFLDGVSLPTAFERERQANCAINEIGVGPATADTDGDESRAIEIVRRNDTRYREE